MINRKLLRLKSLDVPGLYPWCQNELWIFLFVFSNKSYKIKCTKTQRNNLYLGLLYERNYMNGDEPMQELYIEKINSNNYCIYNLNVSEKIGVVHPKNNMMEFYKSFSNRLITFDKFIKYKKMYNKIYHVHYNKDEFLKRFEIFLNKLKLIDRRNKQSKYKNHGINKFTDYSEAELKQMRGVTIEESSENASSITTTQTTTKSAPPSNAETKSVPPSNAETKFWPYFRYPSSEYSLYPNLHQELPLKEAFLPRNQDLSGNCWAHSIAEFIRISHYAKYGIDFGKLSTEHLTSCYTPLRPTGGAAPTRVLYWIAESKNGVFFEKHYKNVYSLQNDCLPVSQAPVKIPNINGTLSNNISNPKKYCYGNFYEFSSIYPQKYVCKANLGEFANLYCKNPISYEDDIRLFTSGDDPNIEAAMLDYVLERGPILVCINALNLHTYNPIKNKTPIYQDTRDLAVDHAVLIVGYNTQYNAWIMQNSWGYDWGVQIDGSPLPKRVWPPSKEGGYFFVKYGINALNMCSSTSPPVGFTESWWTTNLEIENSPFFIFDSSLPDEYQLPLM